jgi:23S rRNA (cytidine1920-2'-O)/16S rRNA (cytidine1409-2'-O)-methyltransferase
VKERADQALVTAGLARSRSQASQFIKAGYVSSLGEKVTRPSQKVDPLELSLKKNKEEIFVGRGAEKLAGAGDLFQISFKDKVIADIGASTGGFTEWALKNGASRIYAIDVGHDQLAPSLSNDSRVVNMEGTNVRYDLQLKDGELVDMLVVDVSFISLKLIIDSIFSILKEKGEGILLVKPQFEVGRENLGKKGIVKDQGSIIRVIRELYNFVLERKLSLQGVCKSPIKGKAGNAEYFFYLVKDENLPAKIGIEELENYL